MKWFILGSYGLGNFGDDLLCWSLLESIFGEDESAQFALFCPVGRSVEALAIPARLCGRVDICRGFRQGLPRLKKSDRLIWGGGTCIHRYGLAGIYWNLAARFFGVPVIWLGVGADDVGSGLHRFKARVSVSCCKWIGARDEQSKSIFNGLSFVGTGVDHTEDLAYLMPEMPRQDMSEMPSSQCDRMFLVAWHDFRLYMTEQELSVASEEIVKVVLHFARAAQFREIVITGMAIADSNASKELYVKLVAEVDDECLTVRYDDCLAIEDRIALINRAAMVVSSRLHPWMVAKIAGIPSVGVNYARKLEFFGDKLDCPSLFFFNELLSGRTDDMIQKLWREYKHPSKFLRPLSWHRNQAKINISRAIYLSYE